MAYGAINSEEDSVLMGPDDFEPPASHRTEFSHSSQNFVAVVTHFVFKVREEVAAPEAGEFPKDKSGKLTSSPFVFLF